ncbi:MAG: hypothetical protein A2787_05160 [Omnitrophica WOR_2 bacterium RIFCSPHIGHO2_01_FULL_48_9]|nr:MAG: hypothetical protein A3D10_08960 [Omnitrophica WOR_2 bacterium RIFCSPHIGHO2_02_FULL_48_11]OGX34001.1 MAG: hypothetical protein A2787_05160 [Omnitrophica WOR_2 bacterium RIFCSPHIGHO2_01_FULL_48_9]
MKKIVEILPAVIVIILLIIFYAVVFSVLPDFSKGAKFMGFRFLLSIPLVMALLYSLWLKTPRGK